MERNQKQSGGGDKNRVRNHIEGGGRGNRCGNIHNNRACMCRIFFEETVGKGQGDKTHYE